MNKFFENLKEISFRTLNNHLESTTEQFLIQLQKRRDPKNEFYDLYSILKGILLVSFQTYKAIKRLLISETKFPVQADILSRTLIDAFFNISALLDNPKENCKKYELSHLRYIKEYIKEIEEFEKCIKYTERFNNSYLQSLKDWQNFEGKYIKDSYNLSDENLENIERWPTPGKMLNSNIIISKERKKFLSLIYNTNYRLTSELTHQRMLGILIGWFYSLNNLSDNDKEYHKKIVSDILMLSTLFFLMMLSEIEITLDIGYKKDLKDIWEVLIVENRASIYYHSRYKKMLAK